MFKKILRFGGNVLKGVVKSVPGVGVILSAREKQISEIAHKIKNGNDFKNDQVKLSSKTNRQLYELFDLVDDGKLNDSFDQLRYDMIIQLGTSLITVATAVYYLIQNL